MIEVKTTFPYKVYYDTLTKKFFYNLLDILPSVIFFMSKDEDGYYTKTGKIWEFYYKNPLCFTIRQQNSYIKTMNILYHGDNEYSLRRLRGDLWSKFKYRTVQKQFDEYSELFKDDCRYRYLDTKIKKLELEREHMDIEFIYYLNIQKCLN